MPLSKIEKKRPQKEIENEFPNQSFPFAVVNLILNHMEPAVAQKLSWRSENAKFQSVWQLDYY